MTGDGDAAAPFTDDDLATLFLVSQVERRAADAGGIEIGTAAGGKCARCWLIKRDLGADPVRPDICARCAAAVSG